LSLSDALITDQNKQTSSNNKRYYLSNLLQFLCHTYHLHWEPANKSWKSHLKPASQPCFLWCKPSSSPTAEKLAG